MTLQQIEARLAEIQNDIETRGDSLTAEQISAYTAEVDDLKTKRTALIAGNQQRQALISSIAEGREGGVPLRRFNDPNANRTDDENDDPLGTVNYRKAFMNHVLRGTAIPAEFRADAVTKTTDVGAVIPTTVINTIVQKLESSGMILPLVTKTSYKGGVEIPVSNVKPAASWVAEGAKSDKQKMGVPKSGAVVFTYHKLRCAVAVTLEVDNMALAAFEAMVINNIVEAMTKALEQAIISGTGSGQPKGIIAETPAAGQAIDSSAPSYADLITAEAALPVAYEAGAAWCMSKKTFMSYYGLTDTNGQPVGRVNYGIAGKPERFLLGRPVVICDYITSYSAGAAAGTVFAFLFNFSDYAVNTNYSMGVKKYEDNDTDDQITKAVMLVDGKVVDKGSLVTIKKKA